MGTLFVWVWSWFIARDILRMTVSAVIGCWYFLERRSDPTDELQAAIYRATSPSLGTNCLSALVMAGVHLLVFLIHNLSRVRAKTIQMAKYLTVLCSLPCLLLSSPLSCDSRHLPRSCPISWHRSAIMPLSMLASLGKRFFQQHEGQRCSRHREACGPKQDVGTLNSYQPGY